MSPLIQYALKGLGHCYLPDKGSWSYIYHLDGRPQPNESHPAGDCFYSLNVVLGLAACGNQCWQGQYDLPQLLHHHTQQLQTLPVRTYALGMALWAAGRLQEPLLSQAATHIYTIINDRARWRHFTAQDAGMILAGLCEQKTYAQGGNDETAHALFGFIRNHFLTESGLFRNNTNALRKNFASFATQAYLITACYHYGKSYNSYEALTVADRATRTMIGLQGPQGEWPWFYFAPEASVVDMYEIYSVHQYGMAPLFLRIARERDVPGSDDAIRRGFDWVLGKNPLNQNMMIPPLGMFYRSLAREGELRTKYRRFLRSAAYSTLGRPIDMVPSHHLAIRRECRSYELGWLLYSFGNCRDMPEITHHVAFNSSHTALVAASPSMDGDPAINAG